MFKVLFALILVFAVLSCSSEPAPVIPRATLNTVTDTIILSDPLIRDASIGQDGDDLSLVLVVGNAINEQYAKELGDNFVRMLKSLGPDDPPGQAIGPGKYNYLIGVYFPDGQRLALGAKASNGQRITW